MELRKVTRLAWRKLLDSEYGTEGLLYLKEQSPSIHAGDQHQIIFNAGKAEGYKDAIKELQKFAILEDKSNQPLENP